MKSCSTACNYTSNRETLLLIPWCFQVDSAVLATCYWNQTPNTKVEKMPTPQAKNGATSSSTSNGAAAPSTNVAAAAKGAPAAIASTSEPAQEGTAGDNNINSTAGGNNNSVFAGVTVFAAAVVAVGFVGFGYFKTDGLAMQNAGIAAADLTKTAGIAAQQVASAAVAASATAGGHALAAGEAVQQAVIELSKSLPSDPSEAVAFLANLSSSDHSVTE